MINPVITVKTAFVSEIANIRLQRGPDNHRWLWQSQKWVMRVDSLSWLRKRSVLTLANSPCKAATATLNVASQRRRSGHGDAVRVARRAHEEALTPVYAGRRSRVSSLGEGNRCWQIREPGRRGRVGKRRASTSTSDAWRPTGRGITTAEIRVYETKLRRSRRDASPTSIGAFPEIVLANTMTKMAALGNRLVITYPRVDDREERGADGR